MQFCKMAVDLVQGDRAACLPAEKLFQAEHFFFLNKIVCLTGWSELFPILKELFSSTQKLALAMLEFSKRY